MVRVLCAAVLCLSMPVLVSRALGQSLNTSKCSGSGEILVTDPAGDGAASDPQLDILELRVAEHPDGAFAGRLVVRLRVERLDSPAPAPAAWWAVSWKGPQRSATTELVMSTCGSQQPTFAFSYSDSSGSGDSGAPDSAWFTASGEIIFAMDPARIGDPQPGDTLHDVVALTVQFARADAVCLPGVVVGNDGAGTGTYVVGSCVLDAPRPAPLAATRLGAPAPNPAIDRLMLALEVPETLEGQPIEVVVSDVAGRRVRSLVQGPVAAGRSRLTWDLRDASGVRVRPGVYWVRLRAPNATDTRMVSVTR